RKTQLVRWLVTEPVTAVRWAGPRIATKPVMKTRVRTLVFAVGGLALLSFTVIRCGGGGNDPATSAPPPNAGTDNTEGIGNVNFGCMDPSTGQPYGQQQQQMKFQPQQQQGCDSKNGVKFFQNTVDDFEMNLDCGRRVVTVWSKGFETKQAELP